MDYNLRLDYAYILILLTVCCTDMGHGTILINPSDTSVIEGQSAILYCEFQVDPASATVCGWTRDYTLIDVSQFSGVYEWIGDSANGNCSLMIVNALLDRDEGLWRCQIPATKTQTAGETSQPAKLTVDVQPSDPLLFYSTNQSSNLPVGDVYNIVENATANITCTSDHGNPQPNLSWIFNSEDLQATKDVTSVDNVRPKTYKRIITLLKKFSRDDNGKILRCDLRHESLNNTEKYKQTKMNIQYGTTTVEILSPNYVLVDEGSGYSFVCKADGNPVASCEWMHKTDNSEWTIISEVCQYEIISATAADTGQYMCLAGNSVQKMWPSPEIQFDLRNGSKNIVGIIAGVFGAVLIVAVVILTVVVIKLRRRMKAEIYNSPITQLPSMAELNRFDCNSVSSRGTTINREPKIDRDTYMIPVPNERAPLCPPLPPITESDVYRDKTLSKISNSDRSSTKSKRNADSNIYSEPHIYEEIIDRERRETSC